ncbi:MAG: dihydroorotate dehydrogenase electron transfer subunit [Caldiserica bacterium]|nr:dihydroorotate dehydrogenase electron transfer subunit [Caldisericota bacterium]
MTSPSPACVEGATVLAQERLTEDVYRLTVATTTGGTPGQFYMVRSWDREPLLARPISIHKMNEDTVSFLYQVCGRGTELLARLEEGGEVTLTGPLGHGFRIGELRGRIAIVTGGIGIAPTFCLACMLPVRDVTVIAGFESTPYAVAELLTLGVDVRVATEDGSDGTRGFCTEIFDPPAFDTVVTCGPMPMMARVAQLCAGAGVPCQASLEARMACGIGACLVCPCPTVQGNQRVCADGPVFDAAEVIWHA